MNYIKKTFDLVQTEVLFENIHFFSYMFVCFFIPFVLGHPQWLVGSIVNCALILGALNLKFEKVLPVIMIPSIGVLSAGLLFGTYTIYLLYLIPFIWLGNAILVFFMKYYNLHKNRNYFLSLTLSSTFKTIFLFFSVFILVKLAILPTPFLVSFGMFQLYTAMIGGSLAFGIQKLIKSF